MRAEARRRAILLRDVPREEIVARFLELAEEIRREAIAKGTAVAFIGGSFRLIAR